MVRQVEDLNGSIMEPEEKVMRAEKTKTKSKAENQFEDEFVGKSFLCGASQGDYDALNLFIDRWLNNDCDDDDEDQKVHHCLMRRGVQRSPPQNGRSGGCGQDYADLDLNYPMVVSPANRLRKLRQYAFRARQVNGVADAINQLELKIRNAQNPRKKRKVEKKLQKIEAEREQYVFEKNASERELVGMSVLCVANPDDFDALKLFIESWANNGEDNEDGEDRKVLYVASPLSDEGYDFIELRRKMDELGVEVRLTQI